MLFMLLIGKTIDLIKNIPEKNMSIMTATTIAVIIIDIIKI